VLPTLCRTFRPIQKKNLAAEEKKIGPPSNFPFLKEFMAEEKHYFCLCEWENNNISWTLP
jgi:hypothetical protein